MKPGMTGSGLLEEEVVFYFFPHSLIIYFVVIEELNLLRGVLPESVKYYEYIGNQLFRWI